MAYERVEPTYNIEVVPVNIMKADGQVGVELHSFLPSALDGGEWVGFDPQGKRPCCPLKERLNGPQSQSA
jgi:hypothetical protein